MTLQADYYVIEIQPDWVLEPEAMGSKDKFWFRGDDGPEWLFKFPQPNTGQHWSEKIAAEVADHLDILHARVELAQFQGTHGSATETFAREGRELYHGNQILAGHVLGYDPGKTFGHSGHTLENIFLALERAFASEDGARRAKGRLAEYLVLDALIGNTDRHHRPASRELGHPAQAHGGRLAGHAGAHLRPRLLTGAGTGGRQRGQVPAALAGRGTRGAVCGEGARRNLLAGR